MERIEGIAEEIVGGISRFFNDRNKPAKASRSETGERVVQPVPDPVTPSFLQEALAASAKASGEVVAKHLSKLEKRTTILEAASQASSVQVTNVEKHVNSIGAQASEASALLQAQVDKLQKQVELLQIDGFEASTQELERATAATKAELKEFREQLQREKEAAAVVTAASTVNSSKASLWIVIGGLGWDVPASQLRAAAVNILQAAQISPDEYSCLSALAFLQRKGKGKGKGKGKASETDADNQPQEPAGSMVELRFGTIAAAEDAVKRIRAVNLPHSSQRHWANFALTADAKASRLQVHRATDYINGVFANQVPEGQEQAKWAQKIMPKLAIEVEGRIVASIYKGELCMKPPAKEHLTTQQESDCLAAAQSAS